MRNLIYMIIQAAVLSLAAAGLNGCSANRVSLSEQRDLVVEKQNSEKVQILWGDIYQADNATWVSGVLKQQHSGMATLRTHVDVRVVRPDGSVEYEAVSPELTVPRDRLGRGPDWKRFRIRLPDRPPVGSHVSMMVHSGPHETAPAS